MQYATKENQKLQYLVDRIISNKPIITYETFYSFKIKNH